MHLEEGDASNLKTWVVGRLQDISDADSDVLADYVLALIRTDTPDSQLKLDVLESLEDFLKDNTSEFVNEIFRALETGSYKPGYVPTFSRPSQAANPPPQPPSLSLQQKQQSQESRKRSYNDAGLGGPDPNSPYGSRGDRQMKQMRGRGGRGGRGSGLDSRAGFSQSNGHNQHTHSSSPPIGMPQGFPAMPTLPGMPQFDPSDPMSAILAMQAMGMPPLPGMEGLLSQQMDNRTIPGSNQKVGKGVCRDYMNKGYCTRGDACPYQHSNPMVVPGQQDEYDPKDSIMNMGSFSPNSLGNGNHLNNHSASDTYPNESRGRGRGGDRGRGRGRGGNDRGGFRKPNRAEFSHAGPNHDRSITTIVVEQIPEDKFSEEAIREFFSEFGTIGEVTMQPYKRLAIVKYSDYSAARAAYDSPKVIFDNRFVKVYWYKPGSMPTPPAGSSTPSLNNNDDTPMKEASPPLDMEAFAATAAAAQAKLDAKKVALAAMNSKREALEKQKADLASKQAAERQKLLDRLAAKGHPVESSTLTNNETTTTDQPPSSTTPKEGDSAHTLMLRAKVAELEAEAKSLGLPDSALADTTPTWSPLRGRGGRGRSGARGGGSYRGWEGFDPSYSHYRGRGGGGGGRGAFVPSRGAGGGGKYNLDLRTKRVAVTLIPTTSSNATSSANEGENANENDSGKQVCWTPAQDEALRQHLLGVGEFEDIQPAGKAVGEAQQKTSTPETVVIQFKERGVAEAFYYGVKGKKEVAGVGGVDVAWVNAPATAPAAAAGGGSGTGSGSGSGSASGTGIADGGMGRGSGAVEANGDGDAGKQPGPAGAHGAGLEAVSELRGGGQGQEQGQGEVMGVGEGDYDVAEEDDDSWMT